MIIKKKKPGSSPTLVALAQSIGQTMQYAASTIMIILIVLCQKVELRPLKILVILCILKILKALS